MSWTICRETPMRGAVSLTESPSPSVMASRSTSPGCTGAKPGSAAAGISVVLLEVDPVDMAVLSPFEGGPPRAIHLDRRSTGLPALERMQAVARHIDLGER